MPYRLNRVLTLTGVAGTHTFSTPRQRYPPRLVASILRGIRALLNRITKEDGHSPVLDLLECGVHVDEAELIQRDCGPTWRYEPQWTEQVIDEFTGLVLPHDLVVEARRQELSFMQDLGVWKLVRLEEAISIGGCQPFGARWVNVDKGSPSAPEVRCRLCVQETKRRTTISVDDLAVVFAATPPLEAL